MPNTSRPKKRVSFQELLEITKEIEIDDEEYGAIVANVANRETSLDLENWNSGKYAKAITPTTTNADGNTYGKIPQSGDMKSQEKACAKVADETVSVKSPLFTAPKSKEKRTQMREKKSSAAFFRELSTGSSEIVSESSHGSSDRDIGMVISDVSLPIAAESSLSVTECAEVRKVAEKAYLDLAIGAGNQTGAGRRNIPTPRRMWSLGEQSRIENNFDNLTTASPSEQSDNKTLKFLHSNVERRSKVREKRVPLWSQIMASDSVTLSAGIPDSASGTSLTTEISEIRIPIGKESSVQL